MTSPIDVLKKEHTLIREVIFSTQRALVIKDDESFHSMMANLLVFLKNFTELYHHPKESILATFLSGKQTSESVLQHNLKQRREDLDLQLAEIIDCYIAYEIPRLRQLTAQYLMELGHLMEEEEYLFSGDMNLRLTQSSSEEIFREFGEHDANDRVMESLKKSYYKISKQLA